MSGGDASGDDAANENDAGRDEGDRGNRASGGGEREQQNRREQEPSAAEKALTAASIVLTVVLFGYVAWQAVQPPDGAHPRAHVVGTDEMANGSLLVHVELTNPGNAGLISATVEADCERPPPDVTLEYVPAGGQEQGVLVCPSGTTRPNVSVSSWVPT